MIRDEYEPQSLRVDRVPVYRDHTLISLTSLQPPPDHTWFVSMIRRLAQSLDELFERFDRLTVLGDGQERAATLDRHRMLLLERRVDALEEAMAEMEQGLVNLPTVAGKSPETQNACGEGTRPGESQAAFEEAGIHATVGDWQGHGG